MSKLEQGKILQNPYIVKCVFLGDENVGKTTISRILCDETFEFNIPSTIGIDFNTKLFEVDITDNYIQKLKLQIWDTAGQERFRSIVTSYLRNVHIGVIVFDMSDRESWENVDMWIDRLLENTNNDYFPELVIIGNKSDKNNEVTENEIKEKCEKLVSSYHIISSSKYNSQEIIKSIFSNICCKFHRKMTNVISEGNATLDGFYKNDNHLNVNHVDNSKYKFCCFQ